MHQLKLPFLAIFSAFFLLLSCGDDDDSIAGTYRLTSFSTTNCDDPEENINFDFSADDGCTSLLGVSVCGDGTITLTESGGFSFTLNITTLGQTFSETGSGTYTIDGNMITICDGTECQSSTFTLGSGRITLSYSEEDDSCIVTMVGKKT